MIKFLIWISISSRSRAKGAYRIERTMSGTGAEKENHWSIRGQGQDPLLPPRLDEQRETEKLNEDDFGNPKPDPDTEDTTGPIALKNHVCKLMSHLSYGNSIPVRARNNLRN
jgi:hypothetical protein